jgi:hypothetical protein
MSRCICELPLIGELTVWRVKLICIIYKHLVHTSQRTQHVPIRKTNQWTLASDIIVFLRKLFVNFLLKMYGAYKRNTCIFVGSWSEAFIGLQHSTVASTVVANSTGCTTCQKGSFSQIASRIGKLIVLQLLLQSINHLVPELHSQCSPQNPRVKALRQNLSWNRYYSQKPVQKLFVSKMCNWNLNTLDVRMNLNEKSDWIWPQKGQLLLSVLTTMGSKYRNVEGFTHAKMICVSL